MVSVAPSSRIRPSMRLRPKTASSMPNRKTTKNPLEATVFASSTFCAPSRRDIQVPEPMPMVNPTAWIMAMREKTIPTAPEALVPSLDTKNVSPML
ncbi:MAG: hypothetical protein BWY99_00639 [Synergistetes bacterium ADurb.BinA166]|nr:MAG: hypothetical protein BWY99_00639 [Synergistetes bacterium ADurb.BinA166]